MKNKKQTIAIVAVGVLLIVAILGGLAKPFISDKINSSNNSDKVPVPNFKFTDAQGGDVNFDDLKGKPVVINFWATWCFYCVKEMEDFDNLIEDYSDRVNFIMMDMVGYNGETAEKGLNFLAENKHENIKPYFDTYGEAGTLFGINSLPVTAFIDENGDLYYAIAQMTTYDEVEKVLLEMLGEK